MSLTITKRAQFNGVARGLKRIEEATAKPEVPAGRVPRISRLMSLAIHMQRLVDEGLVRDYAELARLGHVSRARVTQIMNLNNLSPDLREEILFLLRVEGGRDPIREHVVRRSRRSGIGRSSGGCGRPCARPPSHEAISRLRSSATETTPSYLGIFA